MSFTIVPDVSVAKPGQVVTYTLTYRNDTLASVAALHLVCLLPPQLTYGEIDPTTEVVSWAPVSVLPGGTTWGTIQLAIDLNVVPSAVPIAVHGMAVGDIPTEENVANVLVALPPSTPVSTMRLDFAGTRPQPVGVDIHWTATPSGGVAPYSYKWWLSENSGSSWELVKDWTPNNTYTWHPTKPNPNYVFAVWVRSAGNVVDTYEVGVWANFPITPAVGVSPLDAIQAKINELTTALAARGIK